MSICSWITSGYKQRAGSNANANAEPDADINTDGDAGFRTIRLQTNGSFEQGYTGWTATGNQKTTGASASPIPMPLTDGVTALAFNDAQRTPNWY